MTLNVAKNVTYVNELNSTERHVLTILNEKSDISRDEIASKTSKATRTVQCALASLIEKGYIKRIRAKRNSTWKIIR